MTAIKISFDAVRKSSCISFGKQIRKKLSAPRNTRVTSRKIYFITVDLTFARTLYSSSLYIILIYYSQPATKI